MDQEPNHLLNVAGDSGDSAVVAGAAQRRPLVWFACTWLVGIILGGRWGNPTHWLLVATISTAIMLAMLWFGRLRGTRVWGLIAVALIASAYSGAKLRYVPSDSILRYIGPDSSLVQLTGVVNSSPVLSSAQRGAFAHFAAWESPQTDFVLSVHSVITTRGEKKASGKLRVRIKQADHALRSGELIRVMGWLHGLKKPLNPGDRDERQYLGRKGIDGRLNLDSRGNYQLLSSATVGSYFGLFREMLAGGAMWSLRLGLGNDSTRTALLEALLLGVYELELEDLRGAFRRTGLLHILSISGAHLGILLGLTWLLARGLSPGPRCTAVAVLVVLVLYLLVLPARVPIIRAGLMAGVICVGHLAGRRMAAIDSLGLASFLVLFWRPGDVYEPGFQLSFAITAALLLYTRPVSYWIVREPLMGGLGITISGHQWKHRWYRFKRFWADSLSLNLVAFGFAMPMVAYHFQIISVWSVLISMAVTPVVVPLIWLGVVKIAAGLIFPSMGLLLAGPVEWFADLMMGLVQKGAAIPGVAVELWRPVSLAWAVGTAFLALAVFRGWFGGRVWALVLAVVLSVAWLAAQQRPEMEERAVVGLSATGHAIVLPAAKLDVFAVGNGSCYLLRVPRQSSGSGHGLLSRLWGDDHSFTLMFDCGSGGYLNVGGGSIAPSLRKMGVDHVDVLILSHVDMDHICGSLDLADRIPIKSVLITPQFRTNAEENAGGPGEFLINGLRDRGIPIEVVGKGWSREHGGVALELLWPPSERVFKRTNDSSMVLSIRAAGRRAILNGDIQKEAIDRLLGNRVDLQADVADLPHHGGFIKASEKWLDAVEPVMVVQSSGLSRLRVDRWAGILQQRNIPRLATARVGMISFTIWQDGEISWTTFSDGQSGVVEDRPARGTR